MVIHEMANSDFLHEVYGSMEPGHYGWVCAHQANPAAAPPDVWSGRPYKGTPGQAALIDRAQEANTYYCTAVLRATDAGEVARKREGFVRLAVLVLDERDVVRYIQLVSEPTGEPDYLAAVAAVE